ncbi:MAG: 30S ribosomal protein S8 [Acidobacteriota bacterium]
MMTDPIADLLTRIRNGLAAGHSAVHVPSSGIKKEIARILVEEGFVSGVNIEEVGSSQQIEVILKYADDRRPVIVGIERVSRPGRRVYCAKDKVPVVLNGLGVAILSTSKGVLTDRHCREAGLGGEVICKVW